MTPECKATLDALEGQDLTFESLLEATELTPPVLDAALWRLLGAKRITRRQGAMYHAIDMRHSRAVKRWLFVESIPKLALMCGYVATTYPFLEHLQRVSLLAL